jgi:hypothetical protein
MNPLTVSAQFAAYAWYLETNRGTATHAAAVRFARESWGAFLPCAHKGWGRLLVRVARLQPARGRRRYKGHARPAQQRPMKRMAQAS